jgi:hypothetical protein
MGGRRQAVRSGADDDGVVFSGCRHRVSSLRPSGSSVF